MAKVSDTVRDKIKELYAIMASVTAQRAINYLQNEDDLDFVGAQAMADATETYLAKAGADKARWTYRTPRISQ